MAELTDLKPERTKGEIYEGIAFQFCKIATVALLTGRWALPISSGLCAAFFVMAYANGQRDTRCIVRYPLLAALLFGIVGIVSTALILRR